MLTFYLVARAEKKFSLHSVYCNSPKCLEQVLRILPVAVNRASASHGFLPVEGYMSIKELFVL